MRTFINRVFVSRALAVRTFVTRAFVGDVTIYSQNFNDGGSTPIGWTITGSEMQMNDTDVPVSNGYTGASGGYCVLFTNGDGSSNTLSFNGNLSTVGYSYAKVQFGAYMEPLFPSVVLEWSSNGSVWNNLVFTNVADNSTWALINEVSLPAGAIGVANLQFRLSYTGDASGAFYAIDDFKVIGGN